jgi:hypothetical protein
VPNFTSKFLAFLLHVRLARKKLAKDKHSSLIQHTCRGNFDNIDIWGLYNKTLLIRDVRQMDRFCTKLAPYIVKHKHASLLLNPCITISYFSGTDPWCSMFYSLSRVGSGGIHLGINYSVLNETKQYE